MIRKFARAAAAAVVTGLLVGTSLVFGPVAPASAAACEVYPCGAPVDAVAHGGDVEHHDPLTWAAYDSAIAKGADWVEIDVRWSLVYDRLIVVHSEQCYTNLSWYNVESLPKYGYPGLDQCLSRDVQFLDELLPYYQARGFTNWIIEMKPVTLTGSSNNNVPRALKHLLYTLGITNDVWVSGLNWGMLAEMKEYGWGLPTPRLMKVHPWDSNIWNISSDYMDRVKRDGYQAVNVEMRNVNANSVTYAHSIGLLFSTWAYGAHEEENAKAVEVKADFHMTDRLDDMLDRQSTGGGGGGDPAECGIYAKTC